MEIINQKCITDKATNGKWFMDTKWTRRIGSTLTYHEPDFTPLQAKVSLDYEIAELGSDSMLLKCCYNNNVRTIVYVTPDV